MRIDNPEISPQRNSQLINNKGTKNIQWENNILFKKWCWENSHMWKSEIRLLPYIIYTNITQNVIEESIKDLNVRTEGIKFLEENIRNKFLDVSLGNIFFNLTPKAKENMWEHIKLCSRKTKWNSN